MMYTVVGLRRAPLPSCPSASAHDVVNMRSKSSSQNSLSFSKAAWYQLRRIRVPLGPSATVSCTGVPLNNVAPLLGCETSNSPSSTLSM